MLLVRGDSVKVPMTYENRHGHYTVYTCSQCGEKFVDQRLWSQHYDTHEWLKSCVHSFVYFDTYNDKCKKCGKIAEGGGFFG